MQRSTQPLGGRRVLAALGTALVAGLLAACDSTTPPAPTSPTARPVKANADITLPGCNFDTCTSPPPILFTNTKDGNAEIYSMGANGSPQKRLTFNPAVDNYASWSPDYTKIVFASTRNGGVFNLFTMNADGSNVQQLTYSGINTGPRFSPDGAKIAFHRTYDKRTYLVWVMNADGTNQHPLRNLQGVDDGQPAWSPDGTRIAFKSNAADPAYGGYDIWTVRSSDGGDPMRLTTTLRAGQPAYSPTGTKIAFVQGSFAPLPRGIYLTSAFASGTPTLITTSAGYDEAPSFRPDGKRIAFASTRLWGGMTGPNVKWSILTSDLNGKFLSAPSQSMFVDNIWPSWGVH